MQKCKARHIREGIKAYQDYAARRNGTQGAKGPIEFLQEYALQVESSEVHDCEDFTLVSGDCAICGCRD